MHVLVTGGSGFVGQWLIRTLVGRGDAVYATSLTTRPPEACVLSPEEWGAVRWLQADVRNDEHVTHAVETSRPDLVIHLAGVSFVPDADSAPVKAYDVNALGAVRLLSAIAVRRAAGLLDPTIVVVGSAEQYGRQDPSRMPLSEEVPLAPLTLYAASKTAQEIAALQFYRSAGLRVVLTRSFNHSGVGHGKQFLLPALIRRALAVRAGFRRELAIGNEDTVRDFLHIDDVVRAYLLLAERGTPGEVYNVCSGRGQSVGELARMVLDQMNASADIVTDPALVRRVDVPVLVGSPAKLTAATRWTASRTTADIISDLIDAATH